MCISLSFDISFVKQGHAKFCKLCFDTDAKLLVPHLYCKCNALYIIMMIHKSQQGKQNLLRLPHFKLLLSNVYI